MTAANLSGSYSIEKVVDGNGYFKVTGINFIPGRTLNPCDDLTIELKYESSRDYKNLEMETVFYRDTSPFECYLQETNLGQNQELNIAKGAGKLTVTFRHVPVNNGNIKVALTLWNEGRSEMLFWWRGININFNKAKKSTGEIHIPVIFKTQ